METRLWELYNFIKDRTMHKVATSVEDVCTWLPEYYTNNAKECNYSNCPTLYKDIDLINESVEIEKIIIKDNNNFYLGTEEQCKEYALKLRIKALKQLKKYWNIYRKMENNGKGKFISCKGDPITEESKARTFVQTFADDLLKDNDNE